MHVQLGTNREILKTLGGWSERSTVWLRHYLDAAAARGHGVPPTVGTKAQEITSPLVVDEEECRPTAASRWTRMAPATALGRTVAAIPDQLALPVGSVVAALTTAAAADAGTADTDSESMD